LPLPKWLQNRSKIDFWQAEDAIAFFIDSLVDFRKKIGPKVDPKM